MAAMNAEESANIVFEADDFFGIPPVVAHGVYEGPLEQDNDWGRQGLTQWFDGAIDGEGGGAAGVEFVAPHNWSLVVEDATPAVGGYENLWSGIEEPVVLGSRSRLDPDLARYTREVENPQGGSAWSISAADMLQLPLMRNEPPHSVVSYPTWSDVHASQARSYAQVGNISNGPTPFLTRELEVPEEDEREEEMLHSQAGSIDLAMDIISDGVTSISLGEESVGEESDDDDSQEIVSYTGRRSNPPHEISQASTQYGLARPGSGRVVRENMMYEWLHKSDSAVIILDESKRREMERVTMGTGPCDVMQPLEVRQQPGDSRWAEQLLNLCAGAIATKNIGRTQHLMWVLNELASFFGDGNQRLAAYGLKALFCKITGGKEAAATWMRPFHHQEKTLGPKAVHRALVTFHEFNVFHQVAYTVTNETLLEVFAGKSHLHIVDVGVIKGLQWPILIDALSNRQGGPPSKLRITTIRHQNFDAQNAGNNQVDADSADFMKRLVTFAKVLGLDCELDMYVGPLESITKENLKLEEGEVLAVCCQFRLHRLSNLLSSKDARLSPRDAFLEFMFSLKPSVVVVSENDVDMLSEDFLTRFKEVISFWWTFFESTHLAFKGREPEAQQIVEYEASMIMLNSIACEGAKRIERNDRYENWMHRIRRVGFAPMCISEDTKKTVQVLLQNTESEHWSVVYSANTNCVNLSWKDQPVNFTSLWKAPSCSRKLCKCNMLHD